MSAYQNWGLAVLKGSALTSTSKSPQPSGSVSTTSQPSSADSPYPLALALHLQPFFPTDPSRLLAQLMLRETPFLIFPLSLLTFSLSHPPHTHSLLPAPCRPLPQDILCLAHRVLLRDGQPTLAPLTCNQGLLAGPSMLTHSLNHNSRFPNLSSPLRRP